MAANSKFATLLHRNTNRVTMVLVYAVLEWVLIVLLLLNSLFSYLIAKFAKWVGLKPPCPFCSRLDHVLEPAGRSESLDFLSGLVCEAHVAEISDMGFCSNHQRMASSKSMCLDCLASRPNITEEERSTIKGIALVSWLNNTKKPPKTEETETTEETECCSCCNKSLNSNPSYLLLESSWGDRDYTKKGTLVLEAFDDDDDDDGDGDDDEEYCEHHILSDIESFILREVAESRSDGEKDYILHRFSESIWEEEDRSIEVINMHFEKYGAAFDDYGINNRVIPVELIDSFDSLKLESGISDEGEGEKKIETFATDSPELSRISFKNYGVSEEKPDNAKEFECTQEDENDDEDEDEDEDEDLSSTSEDADDAQNAFDEFIAQNNICKSQSLPYDGSDIEEDVGETDYMQGNLPQPEEPSCSSQCIQEEDEEDEDEDENEDNDDDDDESSSTSNDDAEVHNAFDEFIAQNKLCAVQTVAEDDEDVETNLVKENQEETIQHQSSKFFCEACQIEEDKLPETPSSMDDGLHYLHRKLMLLEKAEDSIDGSDTENAGDPVSTIDRLKSALKAERKALTALYQELEEERNASAIAANQTMAMITRLQEEKASMQMEALQYQRMMEEQSEYDQEALQLLNDLMTKREKEKKELEKELEEYKQKVLEYEAREKLRVLRRMKNESSSSSSEEELSIDLNYEAREEDDNNNNTKTSAKVSSLEEMTTDCLKQMSALDNSLAEFEEEKMSILDQLKALEEKLLTMGDNEQFLEDDDDDEFIEKCKFSSPEEDLYCNNNGFISDDHNKQCNYSPRRPMGCLAKRLLPYLDAADDDEREMETSGVDDNNKSNNDVTIKVSIEEEVDHVYERLQALETDTDFLRHCMGSIQKGDKGMDLLQEILQHLHDLKDVELRLKDLGDDDDPIR